MKVSLVVASGAHEGRVIPFTGPQFLIGRDQQCHLRPASQAISKLHCAVTVRDGKVYVQDFGSTNGTLVNDKLLQNAEVPIENGATLRVGPLDFRVRIEVPAAVHDGTPLPSTETAAALAAVKAATAPKAPVRDATPNPARPFGTAPQSGARPEPAKASGAKASGTTAQPGARPAPAKAPAATTPPAKPATPAPTKPGSKESPALTGSKESAALKPDTNEGSSLTSSESVSDEDHDRIAAMLLGMDETGNGSVPDGSTVMDMPSPLAAGGTGDPAAGGSKPGEPKKDDKPKPAQTREEMTSAANDLLRKYMRRPK